MKPLDDMEPQDIAREVARVIDGFTTLVANGGPAEASRAETVMLLQKSADLMRIWAEFGRWYTKDDLRGVARHALWLNAREADRMQNLVTYEDADLAVKEWLAK